MRRDHVILRLCGKKHWLSIYRDFYLVLENLFYSLSRSWCEIILVLHYYACALLHSILTFNSWHLIVRNLLRSFHSTHSFIIHKNCTLILSADSTILTLFSSQLRYYTSYISRIARYNAKPSGSCEKRGKVWNVRRRCVRARRDVINLLPALCPRNSILAGSSKTLSALLIEVQWVLWTLVQYVFHTVQYKLYTTLNITTYYVLNILQWLSTQIIK
jgi:hypothetical protein